MKTILLVLSIVLFGMINAQTPNWGWANAAGGYSHDFARSISVDANGNCYVTGYIGYSPAAFDSFTLGGNSSIYGNFFIAKYDSTGSVVWAKKSLGIGGGQGLGIKTDAAGNSYVLGSYGGTLVLGSFTLIGIGKGFIAKYDPSGNVVWAANAIEATGVPYNKAGIAIDASGNSYVIPQYDFGFTTDSATIIIKYNAAGSLVWKKHAKSTAQYPVNNWKPTSIATDANGNSYLCGTFASSVLTIGGAIITKTVMGEILFVAKYDNAGNVLWAKSAGATGTVSQIEDASISIDLNGNAYVTGYFMGNSVGFGNTVLTKTVSDNGLFVAKFDNSGNILWAKSATPAQGNAIANDAIGNIYVLGFFGLNSNTSGTVSTSFGGISLYGSGRQEIFVTKYDPSGNVLWAKSAGGESGETSIGLAIDGVGNAFATGNFYSHYPVFGTTMLNNCDTIPGEYNSDIFVARLDGGTPTGIDVNFLNRPALINGLKVIPNPLSGDAVIKTNIQLVNGHMTLYNSSGQALREQNNITGTEIKFSRENLPPGLYFIQIKENHRTISSKFVVTD